MATVEMKQLLKSVRGHLDSCHGSDLLSHPNSDEKTGGHSFLRKKQKPLKLLEFQGFGGDYWTRTSDLLRVKQAL